VTGASDGIGRETARRLAQQGAPIVLWCRDPVRGRQAQEDIRRTTHNDAVDLCIADLASQREIRRGCAEIRERHDRLDVLVNNAAVVPRTRRLTEDGIEMQFAVNHLAGFLLVHLLADLLRAAPAARVVNVASYMERNGVIDFDGLRGEGRYDPHAAYCRSKLANVLFTYELARRVEGTTLTANCLHPGVVATKLLSDLSGRPRALGFMNAWRYAGHAEGAATSVYLALSPDVEDVSGRFFVDQREASSSPASYDRDLQARLWQTSLTLTGTESIEKLPRQY